MVGSPNITIPAVPRQAGNPSGSDPRAVVGGSYGGMVIGGVDDRVPEKVASLELV
jgi:hypothetical protein